MLNPHRETFRAFATTVVPEMTTLDDAGRADVERTVEHAIAQRAAKMQRQLSLLLHVIEFLPRFRYGRGISRLSAEQRSGVIDTLRHAPVALVRHLF